MLQNEEASESERQSKLDYFHGIIKDTDWKSVLNNLNNPYNEFHKVISDAVKMTKERYQPTVNCSQQPISEGDSVLTAEEFLNYFLHIGLDIHETISVQGSLKTDYWKSLSDSIKDYWKSLSDSIKKPSYLDKLPEIKKEDVEKIVQAFKNTRTLDPYGLSNKSLQKVLSSISEVVAHIITTSFHHGVYPDELKLAYITPELKDPELNASDKINYRPLSMLPRIAIIFETVVKQALENHLLHNDLCVPQQHAYIKGRSSVTALLSVFHNIDKISKNNEEVVFVQCDLRKAFDTINIDILLDKLEMYGVRGKALDFFKSYFRHRKVIVKWKETTSDAAEVSTGLLQGSALSPLLFNIYLSDLPRSMSCEVITYSDDIAFVASSTKIDSKQILSQADNWFSVNSMKINEKKSKTLSQCGTLKYLGVHMNRHYTWTLHIEYLEEKLKDAIEAIRNAKEEKKRDVYFKKFHTKIAYATILWGNAKEAENIFKKQIEAVALLSGSTSVDKQVFKANNIMTLHSLYIQQCLRFVHKLRSDPSSHNQYLKDFLPATAFELYNLVPHNFYKYDFNEFKVIIKEVCLSASFYNIQDFIAFDWTTKIPQVNVSIQNSEIQTLNEQLDEAVNKIRKTYFAKFQSILTNGNKLLMCSDGELQEIFDKQKRTMSLFLNTSDVEQKVFIDNKIYTVPSLYIRKCIIVGFKEPANQNQNVTEIYNHLPNNIRESNYDAFIHWLNSILLAKAFYNLDEFYQFLETVDVSKIIETMKSKKKKKKKKKAKRIE